MFGTFQLDDMENEEATCHICRKLIKQIIKVSEENDLVRVVDYF
jgi:hypothetical protein